MVGGTFEGGAPRGVGGKDRQLSAPPPATTIDPEAAKAVPYGEIISPSALVALFLYAVNVFDQPTLRPRRFMPPSSK
jgi:hypothetical protein